MADRSVLGVRITASVIGATPGLSKALASEAGIRNWILVSTLSAAQDLGEFSIGSVIVALVAAHRGDAATKGQSAPNVVEKDMSRSRNAKLLEFAAAVVLPDRERWHGSKALVYLGIAPVIGRMNRPEHECMSGDAMTDSTQERSEFCDARSKTWAPGMEKNQERRSPIVEWDRAKPWPVDWRRSPITRARRMNLDDDHSASDRQPPEYDCVRQVIAKSPARKHLLFLTAPDGRYALRQHLSSIGHGCEGEDRI